MKTVNYVLTIALMVAIGSCSKEASVQNSTHEELAAVEFRSRFNQKKKSKVIFEVDLSQYYLLGSLSKLDYRKKQLEQAIEGGSKHLIPKLEATIKDFSIFEETLWEKVGIVCHLLGLEADILARQAELGDIKAEAKLIEIEERLKKCGIKVSYYEYLGDGGINRSVIRKSKTRGGCKIPSRDFYEACDLPLPYGRQTIMVDEKLNYMHILTAEGRIIEKAKFIGENEAIDGFYEYSLTIPSMAEENLSIAVSKGGLEYTVPITGTNDF